MSGRAGKRERTGRYLAAKVCQGIGTTLLVLLVLCCLPLTVPRVFGYQIYTVVSGSMEPEIPVGSLLYIQKEEPEGIEAGEVIAFYGAAESGAIITHRVVENRVVMGELITKGDANEREDVRPVAYGNVIGKVVLSLPGVGLVAEKVTSREGKMVAGGVVVLAVVLQLLGGWMGRRNE